MSCVQLDESPHARAVLLRVPGLDPLRRYRVTDVTPGLSRQRNAAPAITSADVTGVILSEIGIVIPTARPYTAVILSITATGPASAT